jgi:hypothetical protein
VPLKTVDQQGQFSVCRVRQRYVEAEPPPSTQNCDLLSAVGIVLPLKPDTVRRDAQAMLEDISSWVGTVSGDLLSEAHNWASASPSTTDTLR